MRRPALMAAVLAGIRLGRPGRDLFSGRPPLDNVIAMYKTFAEYTQKDA